jgi:hypothetical protein
MNEKNATRRPFLPKDGHFKAKSVRKTEPATVERSAAQAQPKILSMNQLFGRIGS